MQLIGHGIILTLSVTLTLAAIAKLRAPQPLQRALAALGLPVARAAARMLALAELTLAIVALLAPGRVAGALLAALFVGFALVNLALSRRDASVGCGCFGAEDAGAPGRRQLPLTVLGACGAGFAVAVDPRSVAALARHDPSTAAATLVVAAALASLWRHVASRGAAPASAPAFAPAPARASGAAPASAPTRARTPTPARAPRRSFAAPQSFAAAGQRLVDASAAFLEQRFSRRSALIRLAVAGSALSVAPLRYLLYPESALAVIVPSDCLSGECTDGYTAFCCQINKGVNQCPEGTFPGGWWMCTDYSGNRLCAQEGVRYYVDCNALPGRPFPGGCRCANGTCEQQRVACNIFRYGQCNTQVPGITAVVCRMVLCQNPSSISSLQCSSSLAIDDAVCGQDTPCLQPAAVQLAGAGGV